MEHKFKVIPKEEILANRSNVYDFIDFDKQETLEEAFDRIFDSIDYILFDYTSFEQGAKWQKEQYTIEEQHIGHTIDELDKEYIKGFNEGSNYYIERMYSEEEVIQFGKFLTEFNNLDNEIECAIKKLLKQFKNK